MLFIFLYLIFLFLFQRFASFFLSIVIFLVVLVFTYHILFEWQINNSNFMYFFMRLRVILQPLLSSVYLLSVYYFAATYPCFLNFQKKINFVPFFFLVFHKYSQFFFITISIFFVSEDLQLVYWPPEVILWKLLQY